MARLFCDPPLNGFFREECLLAKPIGDVGEAAFVVADRGKIASLTDEIECPKSLPDLL